jgi:hypothetical protein
MKRKVRFRIYFSPHSNIKTLLPLALLIGLLLGYLAWPEEGTILSSVHAAADGSDVVVTESTSLYLRQYYLTKDLYNGHGALNACASGYHFASIWEILDTSNLKYDIALGKSRTDDGFGPPSMLDGWVRTGWNNEVTNYPGSANCNAWTSNSSSDYGTVVSLDYDWDSYRGTVGVWMASTAHCGGTMGVNYVWCVADRAGSYIYLPLVMKGY